MDKLTQEQLAVFLVDLDELAQKHGLVIGGCGCCESPSIQSVESEMNYLRRTYPEKKHDNPRYHCNDDGGYLSYRGDN